MPKPEPVEIDGRIVHESDLAWLFEPAPGLDPGGAIEVWLPKSQCEWDEDEQVMTVPEWLAKAKELI